MPKRFNISEKLSKSIVTPKFRASYCHVLEPWTGDETKTPRYSVQMIYSKDDEDAMAWVRRMKSRIKKIAIEAFGPNAPRMLRSGKLKSPFRDGDDEFGDNDEVYANTIFANANGARKGKKPPGLYDQHRRDMRKMQNPEEIFFSGVYARAEIKFYPFEEAGGKGIACYLFRVQYWETGEPLGGGAPVEKVFDEIETDEDVMGGIEVDDDLDEDDF